ncbi:MAG: hypothetical protein L6Q33_00405 [Bacteriovoracaceae bacterium]|nr:hypothetical protein [Bacteriovoracaceae bacterium]
MDDCSLENSHSLKTTVNSELRELLKSYLERHPKLTMNALSQRAGVAGTTLRRLLQEENRSEVAPHTVLQLVSYIYKERKISKLLEVCTGEIGELLKRSFDQFIFDAEKSDHKLNTDHNELFKDETMYVIYKLAANKFGTSRVEVEAVVGSMGMKKLEKLLSLETLTEDQNGRIHAVEKNFSVDLKLAHQLTHVLLDFYKPEKVADGLNLFYSLSEGLNAEGIKKVKEIEKEAVLKVFEVMNNENYQGLIPYFSIVLSDVMGKSDSACNLNDFEDQNRRVVQ